MFKVSEIQAQSECVTKTDGKEMTENINDRSETEFASVEDLLDMHRTSAKEITLISEIANVINEENVIAA